MPNTVLPMLSGVLFAKAVRLLAALALVPLLVASSLS